MTYKFSLGNYGPQATQNLMGIDPSAPNPFMFSNGNNPINGMSPTSLSSIMQPTSGSPFLPQIGAEGVGIDVAAGASSGNWWDGAIGTKDTPGWGGMAMGAAGGLMNAFMGMKQYGLARDTLEQNKQQFAQNFGAQQKMTNSRLEDRQAARVASNPGAYQSVGDYMKKNGV